jgi:hypothetical protein
MGQGKEQDNDQEKVQVRGNEQKEQEIVITLTNLVGHSERENINPGHRLQTLSLPDSKVPHSPDHLPLRILWQSCPVLPQAFSTPDISLSTHTISGN